MKNLTRLLVVASVVAGAALFFATSTASVPKLSKSKKIATSTSKLADGDLIFQSSLSGQGQAIQLATKSPWSHVGMIFHVKGEPWVFEAVQPVKFTRLKDFAGRGKDGSYTVKRLTNREKNLTPEVIKKMLALARTHEGKNYDIAFNWSDTEMYCSEVVWKIYEQTTGLRIGEPQPMRTYDLSHPIVKRTMEQRYGNKIPLDEPMIAPGSMYDSELLETVMVKS